MVFSALSKCGLSAEQHAAAANARSAGQASLSAMAAMRKLFFAFRALLEEYRKLAMVEDELEQCVERL